MNVDDATGETLAHAISAMLDAGAHDAWVTPVIMKKGRPAHTVHALVDVALAAQVAKVLTDETGSLGVRGTTIERWPSERQMHEVEVDGRPIRVKVSAGRVKVEHDDAARVARLAGRPVREVVSLAEEAWRRSAAVEPPFNSATCRLFVVWPVVSVRISRPPSVEAVTPIDDRLIDCTTSSTVTAFRRSTLADAPLRSVILICPRRTPAPLLSSSRRRGLLSCPPWLTTICPAPTFCVAVAYPRERPW